LLCATVGISLDNNRNIGLVHEFILFINHCYLQILPKFCANPTEVKMKTYVLGFQDIDRTKFRVAGGKGANLGELYKIKGVKVPEGFCVTTRAYKKITGNNQELSSLLDELACCKGGEREKTSEISARIRVVIEQTSIPDDIAEEVAYYLTNPGGNDAVAVRSSATAEDLAGASLPDSRIRI